LLIWCGPCCDEILRYQTAYQLERNDRMHVQSEKAQLVFENCRYARQLEESKACSDSLKEFVAELQQRLEELMSRESSRTEVLTRYSALCGIIDPVIGRLQEQEYAFGTILRPWGVLRGQTLNTCAVRTQSLEADSQSAVSSMLSKLRLRPLMSTVPLPRTAYASPHSARVTRELPTITPRSPRAPMTRHNPQGLARPTRI
jgi:hypothetical protein